jgi:hypothetical protein
VTHRHHADLTALAHQRADHLRAAVGLARARGALHRQRGAVERGRETDREVRRRLEHERREASAGEAGRTPEQQFDAAARVVDGVAQTQQ